MRFIVATASTGYCPAADSADSITASAPSKIAVATSDTSARVGTGLVIIDSSICVATTTGLPARRAARVICFWMPGTFSSGISTPRSPRATISASVKSMISASRVDRLRLLDLGHHGGAAARDLLRLRDVLGPLDEGERDPVDAGVERRLRDRSGPCRSAPRTAIVVSGRLTPLRSESLPPTSTRVTARLRRGLGRDEPHLAVVEQQRVAGLERREDFRMRQVHARRVARRRDRRRARRSRPSSSITGSPGEGADAQLRPLQVGEDADRPAVLASRPRGSPRRSSRIASCEVWLMLMRNTSAPAANRRAIVAWSRGRRTERRDDLGAAQPSHLVCFGCGRLAAAGGVGISGVYCGSGCCGA